MEKSDKWTIQTKRERPELGEIFFEQKERIWAEFMFHDLFANRLWYPYVTDVFDAYQLYLINEDNAPIAVAQSIPLTWDRTRGTRGHWDGSLTISGTRSSSSYTV